MMTLNHDGTVQTLDATDEVKAPTPAAPGTGTDWSRLAQVLAPVVVAVFKRKREQDKKENQRAERHHRQRQRDRRHGVLRRKPTH